MSALWRLDRPLLLASASVTRKAMLEAAGIAVEALPAPIDERAVEAAIPGDSAIPGAVALALAMAKVLPVSRGHPGRLVLGADQTLACDGARFHKPADAKAAEAQLSALAGRTHRLDSAFALARDGEALATGADHALMTMRPMAPEFIREYLEAAGASVHASVGAYRIEGLGVQLFERIVGCHFTILGLPLLAVCAALRAAGAMAR